MSIIDRNAPTVKPIDDRQWWSAQNTEAHHPSYLLPPVEAFAEPHPSPELDPEPTEADRAWWASIADEIDPASVQPIEDDRSWERRYQLVREAYLFSGFASEGH